MAKYRQRDKKIAAVTAEVAATAVLNHFPITNGPIFAYDKQNGRN